MSRSLHDKRWKSYHDVDLSNLKTHAGQVSLTPISVFATDLACGTLDSRSLKVHSSISNVLLFQAQTEVFFGA